MDAIDEIFAILTGPGNDQWYDNERGVSQIEHALQCGALAEADGAPGSQITAALLHDIGHLLDMRARSAVEGGVDVRHEYRAVAVLKDWFGADVLEPVRLHVAAKRYLTAVEPAYRDILKPDSIRSLAVQGGPMSEAEAAEFASSPYAEAAIALRRWDDRAKVAGLVTPPLEHFRPYLQACLAQCHA